MLIQLITRINKIIVFYNNSSTVAKLESYTAFEIANFVTDHPNILELISIIKESKKVSAEHSKMTVYQAVIFTIYHILCLNYN